MKRVIVTLATLAAGAAVAFATATASADTGTPFACDGTFSNLVLDGDLVVPANGQCQIGASSCASSILAGGIGLFMTTAGGAIPPRATRPL